VSYHAFISYSHAADGKLAPALQSGLQRLAKPWFRLPIIKVFRDQTSLSANPGLWSEIERNLAQSEYFILLASEGAAHSPWVQREVAWWTAHQPIEKLLIVVTDGEIQWDVDATDCDWSRTTCLPVSLKGRFREEALFVDMRWAKGKDDLSLRHSQFRAAVLDLAAPLHSKPKDELDSEDIRQNRRLRTATWSAVVMITVLAIGAMIAAWIAVQNEKKAVRNAITALSRQYAVEAQLRIRDGRFEDAVVSGLKALRTEDTMEARTALFEVLQVAWDFHAVLRFHRTPVQAVVFRKEAKELLTWSADNTLVAWDVARRQPLGQPLRGEPVDVRSAAFSPDGRLLATGTVDGAIILWDADTLSRLHEFREDGLGEVTSLAFNTGGTLLAAGYFSEGAIVVWDLQRSARIPTEFGKTDDIAHDFSVSGLSFSKDGRYLAAANRNPRSPVAVWEFSTGNLVTTLNPSTSFWVNDSVAFLSQNEVNYLIVASSDGSVQLFRETEDGRMPFQRVHGSGQHQGNVPIITVEGGAFATGGGDGLVSVRGEVDGQSVIPASWARASIHSLAFSPSAEYLAAGTADGTVLVYHGRLERPRSLASVGSDGMELVRSPDGKWIITSKRNGPSENRFSVLNMETNRAIIKELSGDASFSRDGRWLVTTSNEGTSLWDLAGQPPRSQLLLQERHQAYLPPAGNFLVTLGGATRVWELAKAPLVGHVLAREPIGRIRGSSTDGKLLLVQSQAEVVVWDLASRRQIGQPLLLEPLKDDDDKYRIELSPDSRWLIVGVAGGMLSLHRIGAVKPGEAFPVKLFYDARFSPDGKWLALRAEGGTTSVWNLGRLTSIFESHGTVSMDCHFSADSRWLVMKSSQGEIQVWNL
jgi:WD40 repeat protein